ncbi:MAG: hypothetical protein H8D43_02025 [Chloroflexi bacterium]|nr:hypothetical protein [Chloroflexota bacterium]
MTLPDIKMTSEMLWLTALVTALIDVGVILFLARRIQRPRFRQLHWPVAFAAGVFWVSYGLMLFALTWESFYAKFLPDPANRSLACSMFELLPYPIIGLVLWWLSVRLPGNPAVHFCLLGGVQSLPEHLWGIYRLGMMDKVPFLQEASVASVLAFAVPEYILYWGSILSIAMLIQSGSQWYRHYRVSRARKKAGQHELELTG